MRALGNRIAWAFGALVLASSASHAGEGKVDFETQVWPILKQSCLRCHIPKVDERRGRVNPPKAGLRLDGKGWILKGSESGRVLVPGQPAKSSLYTLTALPPDDPDVMPAKGDPLTKAETEVLREWIAEGAEFGDWLGEPGGLVKEGGRVAARVSTREAHYWRLSQELRPATSKSMAKIDETPALVAPVQSGSPLLRVEFQSAQDQVDDGVVAALAPIQPQVTILDLSRTEITDAALEAVANMPRLTHLDLRETRITSRGLAALQGLEELRYLNLYGTDVDDSALPVLGRLSQLEAVYLWETRVTPKGVDGLRRILPKTKIQHRRDLPKPAPPPQGQGNTRRRR